MWHVVLHLLLMLLLLLELLLPVVHELDLVLLILDIHSALVLLLRYNLCGVRHLAVVDCEADEVYLDLGLSLLLLLLLSSAVALVVLACIWADCRIHHTHHHLIRLWKTAGWLANRWGLLVLRQLHHLPAGDVVVHLVVSTSELHAGSGELMLVLLLSVGGLSCLICIPLLYMLLVGRSVPTSLCPCRYISLTRIHLRIAPCASGRYNVIDDITTITISLVVDHSLDIILLWNALIILCHFTIWHLLILIGVHVSSLVVLLRWRYYLMLIVLSAHPGDYSISCSCCGQTLVLRTCVVAVVRQSRVS